MHRFSERSGGKPTDFPATSSVPKERILGILGGMGPLATAHFYRTLIMKTAARSDQEHLPVVIWADPRVPDRTDAIVGGEESPIEMMREGLHRLERAGACAVAIPCNTAHAFIAQLQSESPIRIIDMIRATVADVLAGHPQAHSIGILGTRGTRQAGLYEAAATEVGLRVLHVSLHDQATKVDEAIRLVKSGGNLEVAGELVRSAAESLKGEGADLAVAACTEIPLVMTQARKVLPVVDSVESLATACIRDFGLEVLGVTSGRGKIMRPVQGEDLAVRETPSGSSARASAFCEAFARPNASMAPQTTFGYEINMPASD